MEKIVKKRVLFEGVYQFHFENGKKRIGTVNLVPGQKVYGEKLLKDAGTEYRIWNPFRSKLAAAILNGLKELPISRGTNVLYLGIASGTTASHISDIIGEDGIIYGVEFAQRPFRDLVRLSETRRNIAPILEDARLVDNYAYLGENVDVIYADLAASRQAEIFLKNAKRFLKPQGEGLIAIKARSIDTTKPPEEVFESQRKKLSAFMRVKERVKLDPFSEEHMFYRTM
ncbi:MAG: fibrillarin-like rRNA/tRNA 2'-O-methyltransferase [Candidatus Korarchaeota archaeon]|nr:fibrillarin-like rRNA/tRNA 2'-O-methyltransferase [Candidatus Korarchaeota archaeon]NIU83440.1 fibrillarin-like rRNA/tRNA 2'-O-methyltransferase [Candidatus Thorarchaeota archaeon]NIW13716.1 fibrillarin-like rRNA/tRNA 2'-O-methyltransferase [Candidatus Thorarchaeota archaeon]NIW51811.1 fibrillarin-like rRNA/tRNA 2'-O-methyltransferase [Candidatus Korarchaeota archaeon]